MFVSRRLRHIIVLLGSDGRIAVLVTILRSFVEEFKSSTSLTPIHPKRGKANSGACLSSRQQAFFCDLLDEIPVIHLFFEML